MNYIQEYNGLITSGVIVTSEKVRIQYAKLVVDLNQHPTWEFDEDKALAPIDFIETFCRHSKGAMAGQIMVLDLWQKAFISALFGFVSKKSGYRRYKETLLLIGRKNGKSTLLAAIMLYMLIADGEGGSQVVSSATKKDQSLITFNECLNMRKQSKTLTKHTRKRKLDLFFPSNFSTMSALASDSNTLDGLNLHLCVIDELHAIRNRELYEVLKQSMSARKQPIMCMITTAGTVRECIYDDMYNYASKVCSGEIIDDRFLPILYELDKRNEWTDPKCWIKANPALGTIKELEDIEEKVERALVNPNDLTGLLCKDFNIRSTPTTSWLKFDEILNEETFSMEDVRDCYAIGGADLSATTDLTCATLLIKKKDSEKKYIVQMYFTPKEGLKEKSVEDKIPYDKWVEQGLLTACEGNQVRYQDITSWFMKMFQMYGIRPLWIMYDRAFAGYWVEEMSDNGFEMESCAQGALTFSQPMRNMESDLRSNLVNYNNNPILIWCLSNTCIKSDDNENTRPIKGKNRRLRVDGTFSLLNAYVGLLRHENDYHNLI